MNVYKGNFAAILTGFIILFVGCNSGPQKTSQIKVDEQGYAILTDAQVENIVKRSYQYVAMYNVNNKFALAQDGYNTLLAETHLKDHSMRDIARPNNDTFYSGIMLDLRQDAQVVQIPEFDSKYVSMMVTAYDHYVYVPKATRLDDFKKSESILFYSAHTENYKGEKIEGIDNVFEATGDFISVVLRVMPHANEPERFAKIVEQIGQTKLQSLSEYQGKRVIEAAEVDFPKVGKTDFDVYENNFLEVMQFVVNHLSFDKSLEMDKEILACMAPLGIAPGNTFNTDVKIDGKRFRKVAENIQKENLQKLSDPTAAASLGPRIFKPKGETDLEAVLAVSIIGPIGLPLAEAFYPPVTTSDGSQMNAQYDYVIKMTKDELPPAGAFWSLTLYDNANGFFIPNDHKKYSVGENAGMKFNEAGGIEVYVAAEKPEGVPAENWLPLNRGDEDIDVSLRVYVPDLEKIKTWKAPKAEKLK